MNLFTNFSEGISAIRSNFLRAFLTAFIITIGITALVGILTAIDGIKATVNSGLVDLGAGMFDIQQKGSKERSRRFGLVNKSYPEITYREGLRFKRLFESEARTSVYSRVSFNTQVKNGQLKTNPNISLFGVDENTLFVKGFALEKGRNFTPIEIEKGSGVAVIGFEVASLLFPTEDPLNKFIMAYGNKFQVVGILKETGSFFGGQGADRVLSVPLAKAEVLAAGKNVTYDITVLVEDPTRLGETMALARGMMRRVRKDQPLNDDSFEINKSETLSSSLDQVTSSLQVGGFGIGIITLLGAAIGLLNIMLVSVTERTHEIGLRKAVGATPGNILQQFLLEAVLICLLGGSLGIVIGIILGNVVGDYIGASAFIIPWVWISVGYAFCVGVGVASGLYPAVKASKLDPIDALQFE